MKEDYKILNRFIGGLRTEAEKNEYYNRLQAVLPQAMSLTLNQKNIISYIQDSIEAIKTVLLPLTQFGIEYNLAVTGGAVYDLVLNLNDIKDVDIVIYFPQLMPHYYETNEEFDSFNEASSTLLKPLHKMIFPHSKKTTFDSKDLTDIVAYLVKQHYILENKCYSDGEKTGEYLNKVILGLCKINDSKLKKPIDLIISDVGVDEYINFFDFDICKMMILCKKSSFELNNKDLIDYIFMSKRTLYDIENKCLTLKVDNFSKLHIQYFLNKHFLRLKEKLPHHTINIFGNNEEKKNFANAIYEQIHLSNIMCSLEEGKVFKI